MKIILNFESSDGVPMLFQLYNHLEDQLNIFFNERFYGDQCLDKFTHGMAQLLNC